MAGIYFHIPFCKRICAYCDFRRTADLRRMEPLLGALHRELEARAGYLGGHAVRTLYFGGGTCRSMRPRRCKGSSTMRAGSSALADRRSSPSSAIPMI